MNIVKTLNLTTILKTFKSVFSIFNTFSFYLIANLLITFTLLNTNVFTQTDSQAESLKWTILVMGSFANSILITALILNKNGLQKELFDGKGFKSIFGFLLSFLFFAFMFQSFEGRLDTSFVNGYLLNASFLASYMFTIAFFEELIFRKGIIEIIKSKSKNLMAVYISASLIFSLFHYFKYDGNFFFLLFAFISGLFFTYMNLREEIAGFKTFPIVVALHMVYNLYAVGGLNIVLSLI